MDIEGLCKISYSTKSERVKENIAGSSPEDYKYQIENETILAVCLTTNNGKLHRELPYCTIDKIVSIINE